MLRTAAETLYLAAPTPTPTPTPAPSATAGFTAPGPSAPPGGDKLSLLLAWGFWIATVLLVGAVVLAGVKMAMASHGRGSGGEHGMTLLMALVGAVVCGVAATAVTLLLGA